MARSAHGNVDFGAKYESSLCPRFKTLAWRGLHKPMRTPILSLIVTALLVHDGYGGPPIAPRNFDEEILDASFGDYKLSEDGKFEVVEFERPFTGLKFVIDKSGKLEKIIPIVNDESIMTTSLVIIMSKIASNQIEFEDGWKIFKILSGSGKVSLSSFIGVMSNAQLIRPDLKGFKVPKNSEFIRDYVKFMQVDLKKFLNEFTEKIDGDEENMIVDIRKIFSSWH